MFRIVPIFVLGSILLFAGIDPKALAGGGAGAAAPGEIMPQKAYLVFTKEGWGCLGGQEIVADLTQNLTAPKGEPVLLQEVKNPEDVDNRFELYLYYPAQGVSGLPGYYVLRLRVAGRKPQAPGTLRLAQAALVRGDRGWTFVLKAKAAGVLKADLLYAGATRLESGLFTCTDAGLFGAHPVKFLPAHPIRTDMTSTSTKLDPQWDNVAIPLEDFWVKEGDAIAACVELLSGLEQNFSASKDYVFLWDRSKITSKSLNLIASSLEKEKGLKFHVKIVLRDQKGEIEISKDPTPFDPQLKQMMAVQNTQGKIIGGKVWLAVEKPDPR